MAEFKAVIADPKSGKAYKKDITGHYANALIGKKIGEDLDGLYVGLPGYKLQITGGSDKDGFPMRAALPGPRRKGLPLSGGVAVHPGPPAMRTWRSTSVRRTPNPRPTRTRRSARPTTSRASCSASCRSSIHRATRL